MIRRLRNSRGSVLVVVAAAIFPMIGMLSFAIDVSHWFDYSRNLQNRADAAALAAGGTFGGICFGGGAGNTTNGLQSAVGKWAQLYTGAGVNEPAGNLPYSDAAVSAATNAAAGTGNGPGTGWNVATNGYINNTLPPSPVNSPLTLKAGSLSDFWLILNGNNYSDKGGTNFSMAPAGTAATYCNSDPTFDQTDKECFGASKPLTGQLANDCAAGAMVDVKLTQHNVPLFFPLFNIKPTIHAHARVALQGEASSPSAPIAVSDTGFTPCVAVNLVNAATNSVIATVPLSKEPTDPNNPTAPVQWDNNNNGVLPYQLTMPAAANVYVQPFLSDCNGNGQTYDDNADNGLPYGTGVLMINNHPSSDPVVTSGLPPKINTGGVALTGTCANSTQYFAVGACTVTVDAHVTFASDVTPASKAKVFATQYVWDDTNSKFVVNGTPKQLTNEGGGLFDGNFAMNDSDGISLFSFSWEEDAGFIGATDCKHNLCQGNFAGTQAGPVSGIQAEAFDACNGCDQPDDSGPIIFARISETNANGTVITGSDTNTFAASSQHYLVFTLKLAGLNTGVAGEPPTVLRFSVTGNHQTGLVDCGQGNSLNGDSYTVYYGCGPTDPKFSPPLNPLFVNMRNTCGTPPGPPWPSGNHQDCVQTTPGQRRQGIVCPLVQRIVGAPLTNNCNGNVGTCPVNNWTLGNIGPGGAPGGDPRAITMIITSAADLATGAGKPQAWIPIRQFATFYVTGWDKNINPQCGGNGPTANEPYPFTTGKKTNLQNGAIWGHWINYVDAGGITNGQACPVGSPTPVNCVPALTR